jgi:hypothetical protein
VLRNYNIQTIVPSELDQIKIAHVIYAIKAGLFHTNGYLSSDKIIKLLSVYEHYLYKLIPLIKYESININRPDLLLKGKRMGKQVYH